MRRGEIWWAALPAPIGSQPGYRRPVLIVQSDDFTESNIRTVLAVALTTNIALSEAPGNVLLSASDTGLRRDSVANVSQVITVDKSLLTDQAGTLPGRWMNRIDHGLRLVLAL